VGINRSWRIGYAGRADGDVKGPREMPSPAGMTLIELMIVLAVASILAGIGLPLIQSAVKAYDLTVVSGFRFLAPCATFGPLAH
jgi:prepilin-type N-terminal cleavage/methylation domain-containing protein